jgi:hypothetical protein
MFRGLGGQPNGSDDLPRAESGLDAALRSAPRDRESRVLAAVRDRLLERLATLGLRIAANHPTRGFPRPAGRGTVPGRGAPSPRRVNLAIQSRRWCADDRRSPREEAPSRDQGLIVTVSGKSTSTWMSAFFSLAGALPAGGEVAA